MSWNHHHFFFFWPHYTAFGILVLWPGMEPVPKLGVLTMRSSFHMLSMPGLKTVACSMGKIKDIASPPWWPLSTLSVFLQDKGVNLRPLHELQWNFSILISKRIRTLILVNISRLHLSSTINYLKKRQTYFLKSSVANPVHNFLGQPDLKISEKELGSFSGG